MSKPWDNVLKQLIRKDPHAFTALFLPEARFIKLFPYNLQDANREADALLEVIFHEEIMLLHIEFQTSNDPTMANRLLMYNILARNQYDLPVLSCVINLLKDGVIPKSPLKLTISGDLEVLRFHYQSLELESLSISDILAMKQVGLIPLLPLTQEGIKRENIMAMFQEIDDAEDTDEIRKEELKLIGYTLASLVLRRKKNVLDQEWLIGRFHKMHDIIREAPIYQEILREGFQEGVMKGIKEGMKEGMKEGVKEGMKEAQQEALQTLRHGFISLVNTRFPLLATLAYDEAERIEDQKTLVDLMVEVAAAQTQEDAQAALLAWQQKNDA
jgi:predicted transposase/invertase (TIGR01784 family)